MTFKEQLGRLGFNSYSDYLKSDHWLAFRKRFKATRSMQCAVCKSGPCQLHHITYENLGQEYFDDVTPLCSDHHEAVHSWLKMRGLPVGRTMSAIDSLRSKIQVIKATPGTKSGPMTISQKRKLARRKARRERKRIEKSKKKIPQLSPEARARFDAIHKEMVKKRDASLDAHARAAAATLGYQPNPRLWGRPKDRV